MPDFDPHAYLAQVKAQPGPQFDPKQYLAQVGNPAVTPDAADKASRPSQDYMSPGESATNNYWSNVKARITDPNRWSAIATGKGPAVQQSEGSDIGAASLALPLEAAPDAVANLAGYLGKSGVGPMLGRGVANTAIGAAEGAANDDSDRTGGAVRGGIRGALLSAGGEALGGLTQLGGFALKRGAGAMTKMTPEQVEAYLKNPKLAEEVYGEAKNDPGALDQRAKGMADNASSQLQQQYIDPRLADISKNGAGKSFRVNPKDYAGTEAGKVIQDAWNKQGNATALDVPIYEPKQITDTATDTPTDTLIPQGTQKVQAPLPMPDEGMSLTNEQMLRAARASGKASGFRGSSTPAENEAAQANSRAAVNLRKALDTVPGVSQANDEVSHALQMKQQLEGMGNPSRLFSPDDNAPLGSVPVRSLRDFLDQNAGSNFQDVADALSAAKTLNAPHRIGGLSQHLLTQPIGQAVVKKVLPWVQGLDASVRSGAAPAASYEINKRDGLFNQ